MELKFTASVIEAIEVMSQVQRGKIIRRTKGVEFDPARPDTIFTRVDSPVWTNFIFFHRIKARPIRRTRRIEPKGNEPGRWELARLVEFYYAGKLVALVELVGMVVDGQHLGTGLDNSSYWGVSKVGYYRTFNTTKEPEGWIEFEFEANQTGCFVRY